MDDRLKNINPKNISPDRGIQDAVALLLNTIEEQASLIDQQKALIQELKDEINRLKGQSGRPQIRPNTENRDYSSQGRTKKKSKNRKRGPKRNKIVIDEEKTLTLPQADLPRDARLKYFDEVIQQDARLMRTNTLYRVAVYHSASLGKTYRAPLPADYHGAFGANLKALLHVLHYGCDVTQGRLKALMDSIGVSISAGSVDGILKGQAGWAVEEQRAILHMGIQHSPFVQTDSTGNREKGRQKTTHVVCAEFFTVFYTLRGKRRQDVLTALQGHPPDGLRLQYNVHTRTLLQVLDLPQADRATLHRLFRNGESWPVEDFCRFVHRQAPDIAAKRNLFIRIVDAFALGHYFAQDHFPTASALLTDGANEYGRIAPLAHALCWVHDARHYNKLMPRLAYHAQLLEAFKDQYWAYYHRLVTFKDLSPDEQAGQKDLLEADFERIFRQQTHYAPLDRVIQSTYANKDKLLAVLDFPDLPLHNNAAELALRRMVRKRDISLHTMSPKGTRIRDAFLSIVETAAKVRINALDYIADRITGQYKLVSLPQAIQMAYQS